MYNCLGMVQAGELKADDLSSAIGKIEERKYISIPILGISEDRKTVVIADCQEATAGAKIQNADGAKISAVEALTGAIAEALGNIGGLLGAVINTGGLFGKDDDGKTEEGEAKHTTVVLSKALKEGEEFLKILAARNPFEAIGISEAEIENIKGVLKRYE